MPIIYPFSIISINNELFISGTHVIYKSDKYLNLFGFYNRTGAGYRCIYYNYTADILYVEAYNMIDLFYRNLSFIKFD
jgi:hypothetical protein